MVNQGLKNPLLDPKFLILIFDPNTDFDFSPIAIPHQNIVNDLLQVNGLVFNLPFTNISAMVQRIKSLGIHLEGATDAQFASAVYIRCYPNQVLSVWIFLGSVIEKYKHTFKE